MDEQPISSITSIFMVTVAVIFDLLIFVLNLFHLIPFIGTLVSTISTALISIIAWLTFFLWFKLNGISFTSSKRLLTMGGGLFVKILPVINSLPGWTATVLIIIASTKAKSLPIVSSISSLKSLPVPR